MFVVECYYQMFCDNLIYIFTFIIKDYNIQISKSISITKLIYNIYSFYEKYLSKYNIEYNSQNRKLLISYKLNEYIRTH